jgi:hypothetical protein
MYEYLIILYYKLKVEFIRRQANEVAHRLARAATFYASIHYFTVLSDCIQDVLINEMR